MSSRRSLLLQLPRDILHTVYSEWLSSWRDLSCLDVGCVGKGDRESWLSSLSELKIRKGLDFRRLSIDTKKTWFEWVNSRKVYLVEMFPVRLSVFACLAAELDYGSYCPSIRSIEINDDLDACIDFSDLNMLSVLEDRVGLFVKECTHLEGISFVQSEESSEVKDMVFSALRKGLDSNALQSIFIKMFNIPSAPTQKQIQQFIMRQLQSMQDFAFSVGDILCEEFVDVILSVLHEKTTPLRKLCLHVHCISLSKLTSYLSVPVAVHLEVLDIRNCVVVDKEEFIKVEVLTYLGSTFPRLRSLRLEIEGVHVITLFDKSPMRRLLELYESCRQLTTFIYSNSGDCVSIKVDEDKQWLFYCLNPIYPSSREEKEMFVECISLAIQRSQCKLKVSHQPFCCNNLVTQYDDWVLFKSKLSPYIFDLKGVMSEPFLIEALKDLPRLEYLVIRRQKDKLSDLSLAAILEYGRGLKSIWINIDDFTDPGCYPRDESKLCSFSDEMISEMIRGCKMLEGLKISGAGQESMLAVKHHSTLREILLLHVKVSEEELSRLLLVDESEGEKKCVWRRLQKGEIFVGRHIFKYYKDKKCWV